MAFIQMIMERHFIYLNLLTCPEAMNPWAAELSYSRLMMNSRNQSGDVRARIVSISRDGGATWDTTFFDRSLLDPVNQGSILTVGKRRGKNIIAFCNAADTMHRDNLTLRISYDDGSTWNKSILIEKGRNTEEDFTAYSDITKISNRKIGVLYERGDYKEIVFTVVKWR